MTPCSVTRIDWQRHRRPRTIAPATVAAIVRIHNGVAHVMDGEAMPSMPPLPRASTTNDEPQITALDLKNAPSGMEEMAEQWRRKARGE